MTDDALDIPRPRHGWFGNVLDRLADGIVVVDRHGRIDFVNPAAERLTGWRGPEAIGRPIESVMWLTDEASRRRVANPALTVLADTAATPSVTLRASLIAADAQAIPVDVTATALDDEHGTALGVVVVIRDVSELVRVGEVQSRLAAIVDSSADAIASKTLGGVVLSWNPAAERLFGYTAEEMIGRPITVIFPPDRLAEEVDFLARLAKGERVDHYDTIRMRKDGTPIDVSVSLSPIRDGSGRIVAVSKIARDITARKRAEQDHAELLRREQVALQESVNLNRLKDEFIATLSHELRTPINAICGWAHLLGTGKLAPEEAAKAIEVIARNAQLQTQLINDLMDLSAVAVGKMRLNIKKMNLVEVVEAALEAIRPSVTAKGLILGVSLASAPLEVMADAERLQQVIWNLLSNALKFTPVGGRIDVRVERHASFARIVVADTGVGIAPDLLPVIFDRFRQADGSATRRHRGLGLGLAIVKHLVELHGGSVWADSEGVGCGSRFTIELTLLRGHAHPIPAVAPAAVTAGGGDEGDLSGVRILVVDDDEDSRRLVGEVLGQAGAAVSEASSVAEALSALGHDPVDVVVSDIAMPDVDGYVLMRALRRQARPPVSIALTAFATDADRERATVAGFHAHIAKPVLPHELVHEISGVFRRAHTA